jgi:hypothetical protein
MDMERALLALRSEGLGGLVDTINESVESAWPEIDLHPGLDKDQRAELIRHFETIEEALSDVRKIIGVSSENDT